LLGKLLTFAKNERFNLKIVYNWIWKIILKFPITFCSENGSIGIPTSERQRYVRKRIAARQSTSIRGKARICAAMCVFARESAYMRSNARLYASKRVYAWQCPYLRGKARLCAGVTLAQDDETRILLIYETPHANITMTRRLQKIRSQSYLNS